jgi:hypothetical protein
MKNMVRFCSIVQFAELGTNVSSKGPLIRVSPHEVHWNDPEFIDQAYPTTLRKTDKPIWVAQRTGSMA